MTRLGSSRFNNGAVAQHSIAQIGVCEQTVWTLHHHDAYLHGHIHAKKNGLLLDVDSSWVIIPWLSQRGYICAYVRTNYYILVILVDMERNGHWKERKGTVVAVYWYKAVVTENTISLFLSSPRL